MSIKSIVAKIAKDESGKSQVKVGDVREVVGLLSDMVAEDQQIIVDLIKNGQRRKKKKK